MNIKILTPDKNEISFSTMAFSGGERHIQIEDMDIPNVTELVIRANIMSSSDLMDLVLVENALRHQYGEDLKVVLEIPYMPYARQDRVCAPGQAFSMEVFARVLGLMNIEQIITWDCHSNVGTELTDATSIDSAEIIKTDEQLVELLRDNNTVLVCPDKGAVARCIDIKNRVGINDIVFCEKQRDSATGKIQQTNVLADDLSGKHAVITDDICDGGYTFINIAKELRKKNVQNITLFVTHGIFSKGLSVFDDLVDQIVTTNSFPQESSPKLRTINFEYNFNNQQGE